MRPVKIKDQNADFAKPANWDEHRDGPCGTLPVRVEQAKDPSGFYAIYSNWEPDTEELRLLVAGGVVELCCVGGQPPVSITVVPSAAEKKD